MKKFLFLVFTVFFSVLPLFAAEDMLIHPEDLRLVYEEGSDFSNSGGYHLYIRKKSGIESVMLVETTKDPEGKSDNYAYRALEYNPVNGDEIRYLDGKVLDSPGAKYPLMDSTPEADSVFGQAFHIFIPSEIAYGYPWTRNGLVRIGRGTFINIRSFEKKYGDYSGSYADNAFMFDLGKAVEKKKVPVIEKTPLPETPHIIESPVKEPPVIEEPEVIVLTDDYNPVAAETFKNIAAFAGGEMVYSKGPETLPADIMASLDRIKNKDCVDVIFAIDTTGSMKDDIQELREVWIPQLIEKVKEFKGIRLGLLLYRDYGDTYKWMDLPVKKFEFTENVQNFKKYLNSFYIHGTEGGDIPEAVYEALFASLEYYRWREDAERKIILIGDAEPHPSPRGSGKYSKDVVARLAEEKSVMIDAIIVPDNKSDRGR
ncbi:MAG: VWA domain-containing protein [Treponema sp.]|uniref:vWA domain-containing protein n=1 Tax=Treponema sp. TaxID=166 RepID=UPI0025FBF1A6|nr:vWA domain-containing protein [Treponema sp.]MBQ8678916.1 VWA domain-containing protein [Treponema sp.]